MLMETNAIAAETRAIEYLQDDARHTAERARPTQELRTFGLPKSIWWTMFMAYAVFLTAITIATGRNRTALFMLAISTGYAIMYFGTAAVMNAVGAPGRPETVAGPIETATGRLTYGAAFAQILTVPLVIALFGCAIAIIRAIVLS